MKRNSSRTSLLVVAALLAATLSCTTQLGSPGRAPDGKSSVSGGRNPINGSGDPSDPSDPSSPSNPSDPSDPSNPSSPDLGTPTAPMRRLTEEELNHTVRDLFAGITVPSIVLNDGEGKGFDGDVARQTPSDLVVDELRTGSIAIAAAAVTRRDLLLPRQPGSDIADQHAAGHEFVAAFAPRALRRPLTQGELDAYDGLFDASLDEQTAIGPGAFDIAVQLVIQALLQSPSFLYRVEIGDAAAAAAAETVPVAPYEMASRLSYLLWGSMPDQELFDAAAADALRTPEQLEAQARRMLGEPGAHDAVLSFHRQWLDLDKVLDSPKDAATFPAWSTSLAESVRTEADAMIDEAIFGSGDGTLRSLLTTTTTRVDAQVAALYGIPAPAHDWDLVQLPGAQRAGLITDPAFLASRAHAVFGSPVLRGVFVLDRFLCEAPPPPAAVNTTPPSTVDPAAPTTNRQRYEQHVSDTACQGCHNMIDGIGMGLEGYDAIGRYRTTDNGFPVDDSGTLAPSGAGGTFAGGPELAEILADSPVVEDCVARHWLTWMRGRAEEAADQAQIDDVTGAFDGAGGDVKELLVAIVKTPAFRTLPKVTP